MEWIEAKRGFPAVIGLLKAYGNGLTTAQAFPAVLGTTTEEVDTRVLAWMRERFAGPLGAVRVLPTAKAGALGSVLEAVRPSAGDAVARANSDPDDVEAQLAAAMTLFREGKRSESLPFFERARALFPELGGPDSPHWYLAALYKDAKRPADALAELQRLNAITDSHYQGQLEMGRMLEEQGDLAGAARALDGALYISPFEPALHERLAALDQRLGDRPGVVRGRRSLVALDPVDRPEALYQLALALLDAGDGAGARREVLHALEIAPRFQRAQELLLRLHAAAGTEGSR